MNQQFVRLGFWQNGSDFYFCAAGFFRGFCRRNFSHFCGEKVPRKILQEDRRQNPPKVIQQKSLTHFCRGARPKFVENFKQLGNGFCKVLPCCFCKQEAGRTKSSCLNHFFKVVGLIGWSVLPSRDSLLPSSRRFVRMSEKGGG